MKRPTKSAVAPSRRPRAPLQPALTEDGPHHPPSALAWPLLLLVAGILSLAIAGPVLYSTYGWVGIGALLVGDVGTSVLAVSFKLVPHQVGWISLGLSVALVVAFGTSLIVGFAQVGQVDGSTLSLGATDPRTKVLFPELARLAGFAAAACCGFTIAEGLSQLHAFPTAR